MAKRINQSSSEFVFFSLDNGRYALNISKVKEIIRRPEVRPLPYVHSYLSGVFELRNKILPLINLKRWLKLNPEYDLKSKVIIVNILAMEFGIEVDSVERIYQLSWEMIEPADALQIYSDVFIGTIKIEQKLISLLDLEKMVLEIRPDLIGKSKKISEQTEIKELRQKTTLWIAEDSPVIQQRFAAYLQNAGFKNILFFNNGKELWNSLGQCLPDQLPHLVLTDVEMPLLDGFSLTILIKNDLKFRHIPVILISSVVENQLKVRKDLVKAEALVAKDELEKLDTIIDNFVFKD